MKKEIQAKIAVPLTIPFAVSHIKDEHMIGVPQEVFNREITGFTVFAKVEGKTFCGTNRDPETEIESLVVTDLHHVGDEVRIFTDDNIMHGELWLRMILAIPKNMKAIEKAIQEAFEEQNLGKGDYEWISTPSWMEEPEGLPEYLN